MVAAPAASRCLAGDHPRGKFRAARHLKSVAHGEAWRLPPGQTLAKKLPVLSTGGTANVDLARCRLRLFGLAGEDALLAFKLHGRPLSPKHGGPVRFVAPSRYGWSHHAAGGRAPNGSAALS